VIGVKNDVDVGGGFAQFDARDDGSFRLLLGGAVRTDSSLHGVDELLLFRVLW